MQTNLETRFRNYYGLLLDSFKHELNKSGIYPEDISGNLPYPFIPDFGKIYEESDFKIAFVGQDAKYNSKFGLKEFLSDPDPLKYSDLLNFDSTAPEGYPEFIDYTKGRSFWKFVLKFLLLFYNINKLSQLDKWADLKVKGEILGSFVHGNVNSIPKYEDTKERNGINKETWKKIEYAGKVFDNSSHIINAFEPNIVLLLHWGEASKQWLPQATKEFEDIDSLKLRYCFAKETNTHFYMAYHPSARNHSEKEANKIIFAIINSIKEKRIFPKFPGEELIIKQKLIQNQIEKIAKELKLELTITTKYLGLLESGFCFSKPDWKNYEIGFQFENNGFQDFFYGMARKNPNEDFKDIESIKKVFESRLGIPDGSHPKYFIWHKWDKYRNWVTHRPTASCLSI